MKDWPVFRLVAFDHCRVLAPWCVLRSGTAPVHQVRRLVHALEESYQPPGGAVERALASLLYLPASLRQAVIAWREQGRGARAHYGVGHLRQLRGLLEVAWRANLPPRVYYFQRLFRLRDRAVRLASIEHRELQRLLRAVHAGIDCTVLDDKIAFRALCARHGFPTPPILAVFADGKVLRSVAPASAWQRDLFSKPSISYSSHGVACWRYEPATRLFTDGTRTLDRSGLEAWLAAQSRARTLIIQPRLFNVPAIAPISGHALANCRIVTARRSDGTLFVLLASLRMGVGDAITSDDPDFTFCAAVDVTSGRMHHGESKRADRGTFSHHPDTGAAVAGVVLPHWPEMCALALRAHGVLPEIVFVGWDVILTAEGPALLEGNLVWGGNLAQMAGNLPLGATEFPALFLHHYERLPKRTAASAA